MRIKSYFAKSVDEAMVQARAELGTDALLLNTRKAAGEAGKPESYEVVFGTVEAVTPAVPTPVRALHAPTGAKDPQKDSAPSSERQVGDLPHQIVSGDTGTRTAKELFSGLAKAVAGPKEKQEVRVAPPERRNFKPAPSPDLSGELERLHAQMDEIRALIVRSATPKVTAGRSVPELADVYARLMAAEVDPVLSKDIVDRLEASMATDAFFLRSHLGQENVANRWKSLRLDPARLTAFVRAELERRVRVAPQLGIEGNGGGVVALVGPTGAGKTTTIMKLAASDIAAGRPLRLLSLDASRVAGQMQLQSFASNLGIAFATVPSIHGLPALVAEARKNELVLIDTPGYSGTDSRSAELAATVLGRCANVDVHVVVPGYMKCADLRRSLQRYQIFQPSKLLVTKLDETQFLGSAFSEAAHAGLGISFLTHGPAVPEDIRPVTIEDFLAMALDRTLADEQTRAQCA